MEKRLKYSLIIILTLIALQLIFAAVQQIVIFNLSGLDLTLSIISFIAGVLFIVSIIFIVLEKRIFTPLLILLIVFLAYNIYSIISTMLYLINDVNASFINWQMFILAGYLFLTIIAIILSIKIKKLEIK